MLNFLSIDVEDYHQLMCRDKLGLDIAPTSRTAESVLRILDILRCFNTQATFFVVGVTAEQLPDLVDRIVSAGHELATHGYSHRRIRGMSPHEFATDLSLSVSILRGISGQRVIGHRAPAFSLDAGCTWAFDAMLEQGIAYDSSLVPNLERKGQAAVSPQPAAIRGHLVEVPLSTFGLGWSRVPLGGSYFRLVPYPVSRRAISRLNARGQAAVVYLHPYEFDTTPEPFDLRKVALGRRLKVALLNRQYRVNRARSEDKLRTLLTDFRFTSIRAGLEAQGFTF